MKVSRLRELENDRVRPSRKVGDGFGTRRVGVLRHVYGISYGEPRSIDWLSRSRHVS